MNLLECRLFIAPEFIHECCRNCDCRDVYPVTGTRFCCSYFGDFSHYWGLGRWSKSLRRVQDDFE